MSPQIPTVTADGYRPAYYRGAPLLTRQGRHLVSRFSYGITPRLADDVRAAGGARAWFEQQLAPETVPDPGIAGLRDWWAPGLRLNGMDIWQRQVDGVEAGWEVMVNYARWALVRRLKSRRQVHEVMREFWENHFNVPANGDGAFPWRTDFGVVLGERALGSFEELLQTATTHPAMLIYLDNAVSTAKHPNENLGRELLELHTVGRGAYDEDDVKSSARILTGWRVDVWESWEPSYREKDHWRGRVRVMDFSHPNDAADGRPVTREYLSYLAHHPATARRIAHKLAVKFVRDNPSDALVSHLAAVYRRHGTEIKPVLRALVSSEEFRLAVGAKVRDPGEDVVATYRALGVKVRRPTARQAAANVMAWQAANMGALPFGWPRPDGPPIDNESWSYPSRLLASMDVHATMSGGWWPTQDVRYRPRRSWVPSYPMRFDVLVDHLAQVMLHQRSDATLLEACCLAVDCRPAELITRDHAVVQWDCPRLLTVLLDSPAFYHR